MPRQRTILITGCSSGIGRATALEAAGRGHFVVATARKLASLSDLEGRPGIRTAELDVTVDASIERAVAGMEAAEGRVDVLVNNAGYGQYGAVEDVSPEDWRAQYDVNLFGALAMIRAVLPSMRKAAAGTIVNVSSVAGKIAIPFAGPYCSSKHALEAMSDCLRIEVEGFGVRVVVIEPGPIGTKFGDRARAGVAKLVGRPGPYAKIYENAERAMDTEFQRGMLPPESVARVITAAIESDSPRTRYRVTAMAKTMIPLRRFLTDGAMDRLMRRGLKLRKPG